MQAEDVIHSVGAGGNTVYHQQGSCILIWDHLTVCQTDAKVTAAIDNVLGLCQLLIEFNESPETILDQLEKDLGPATLKDDVLAEAFWSSFDVGTLDEIYLERIKTLFTSSGTAWSSLKKSPLITARFSNGSLIMNGENMAKYALVQNEQIYEKRLNDLRNNSTGPQTGPYCSAFLSSLLLESYLEWDKKSSQEQAVSDLLPGSGSRYYKDSRSAAEDIGFMITDPIETAALKGSFEFANYTGTLLPDTETALNEHILICFTGERNGEITTLSFTSGYQLDNLHITFEAAPLPGGSFDASAGDPLLLPSGRTAHVIRKNFENAVSLDLHYMEGDIPCTIRILAAKESPEMDNALSVLISLIDQPSP